LDERAKKKASEANHGWTSASEANHEVCELALQAKQTREVCERACFAKKQAMAPPVRAQAKQTREVCERAKLAKEFFLQVHKICAASKLLTNHCFRVVGRYKES
ncbi:hypothetical protein CLOM_g18408, partial [Closterium sp. NIES-68]